MRLCKMGIEDRKGKIDLEQTTSRPSEYRSASGPGNSGKNATIKAQQDRTRDAIKKTLGK